MIAVAVNAAELNCAFVITIFVFVFTAASDTRKFVRAVVSCVAELLAVEALERL